MTHLTVLCKYGTHLTVLCMYETSYSTVYVWNILQYYVSMTHLTVLRKYDILQYYVSMVHILQCYVSMTHLAVLCMYSTCHRNWYLFAYSHLAYFHFAYFHFAYFHFTYFRPKSSISPTFRNEMKGSESEWANQKQIRSQVISGIIPTDVGHALWQV